MSLGVVGKKIGMTRVFDEGGAATPVTVILVEKNRVTARRSSEDDGYEAVQVTVGERKASKLTKSETGHYAKCGVEAGRGLWEFRLELAGTQSAGFNRSEPDTRSCIQRQEDGRSHG